MDWRHMLVSDRMPAMDKKSTNVPLKGRLAVAQRSTPWHAVSITSGRWCCEAARGKAGFRFLSREAPRLPLRECSSPDSCTCLYRHHADRRSTPRRKEEVMGMRRMAPVQNDRRELPGRRAEDSQ
jgi:hypothetical protein